MKCPDTNGGAAASARSPLYDFDENSKLQRPGKGDIRPFYIEKWQRGHSNRLITSTVLGFEIVIYIYMYVHIYIYFFFSSFSFIIPLSLVRTRFQRDLAVKMFVNIFSRNDLYGEIIIHVYDRYWDTSATLYKFFQIYPWMGIILFDVQLGKVFPFSRWIYSKVGIKPGWVKKLSNR